MNIIPIKETYCTRCNSLIKDFIQHFFDGENNKICFNCFMKLNPDIDYDNQLANILFNIGKAIENIGILIDKIDRNNQKIDIN